MSKPIHSVTLFLTKKGISYARKVPLGINETLGQVIKKTIRMPECDGFTYTAIGKEPLTFYFGIGGKLDELKRKAPAAYAQINLVTMGALDEDKDLWSHAVCTRSGRIEILRQGDIVINHETGQQIYPECVLREDEKKTVFLRQA